MFTKIFIILMTALACNAQATSRCSFLVNSGDYTCRLDNMNVATENDYVNLSGTHMTGRDDQNITVVIFNHGRMTTAFPVMVYDRFPNLHTVFITGNLNVQRFAFHQNCQRLRRWSFEGPANAITTLSDGMFRGCGNLEEIRVHRAVVHTVGVNIFADTPNLRRLIMPRNAIVSLTPGLFNGLTQLEHLDIERNNIVTFHPQIFQGLPRLRHVQCGQLQNREWPTGLFTNLPSLVEINVNWSGLQVIQPGAIGSLPSLEVLRIYGEVRRLSANIFSAPLPRLHTLNIGTNAVNAIQRGFFGNLPTLRHFYAARNVCTNQNFLYIDRIEDVKSQLEPCFNAY